jgi:hypothetical protein
VFPSKQSWLSGQAGIRDDFQNAMTNIHGMSAEMYSKGSALAAKFAEMAQQESSEKAAQRGALYGTAITAGAGLLGSMLGAGAGGTAGAAAQTPGGSTARVGNTVEMAGGGRVFGG